MSSLSDDWAALESLARRCADREREDEAWPALMLGLEPKLRALVRYERIGRLREREDDLRNIVVDVFEKLSRERFRVLTGYFAYPRRPGFRGWVRAVLRTTAIDYLRRHAEYSRDPEAESRWVKLATLTSGIEGDTAGSLNARRRQVLCDLAEAAVAAREAVAGDDDAIGELARTWKVAPLHVRRLVAKGQLYHPAFELALAGHTQAEIASRLGVTRREIELVIQYAEEFLHLRYRSRPDGISND